MFYFVVAIAVGIIIGANWEKLRDRAWSYLMAMWEDDQLDK